MVVKPSENRQFWPHVLGEGSPIFMSILESGLLHNLWLSSVEFDSATFMSTCWHWRKCEI